MVHKFNLRAIYFSIKNEDCNIPGSERKMVTFFWCLIGSSRQLLAILFSHPDRKRNVSVIIIQSKLLPVSSVYINLSKSGPIKNDSVSRKRLKNSEAVTKNIFASF